MPAGAGGAPAAVLIAVAGLPGAVVGIAPAGPGPGVGAAAATTTGAVGCAASATISSMARSMGIRTLLLVAGLTHPYDESSVFPWFRSSSVFLASLTWSADRGAGGGVRFANVIVKK